MRSLVLLVALAVAIIFPITASARSSVDLDFNFASYHTEAWARQSLNQFNPGLGITYHWNRTWAVMGGEYKNSYRRPTWYALAAFTPLQLGRINGWHVDAGLAAGLASGYRSSEVPSEPLVGGLIVRLASPSGIGLNLLAVPNSDAHNSGFIGFQLVMPWGGAR
jgi:hypothetical protein